MASVSQTFTIEINLYANSSKEAIVSSSGNLELFHILKTLGKLELSEIRHL